MAALWHVQIRRDDGWIDHELGTLALDFYGGRSELLRCSAWQSAFGNFDFRVITATAASLAKSRRRNIVAEARDLGILQEVTWFLFEGQGAEHRHQQDGRSVQRDGSCKVHPLDRISPIAIAKKRRKNTGLFNCSGLPRRG